MENEITRVFPALRDIWPEVLEFTESEMEKRDASLKAIMAFTVSLEEMFVNVASYAYQGKQGEVTLSLLFKEDNLTISLDDSGIAFDPLTKADPDITLSAEERRIGGLGIYMVKKTMDKCEYERIDGHNIFRMTKKYR